MARKSEVAAINRQAGEVRRIAAELVQEGAGFWKSFDYREQLLVEGFRNLKESHRQTVFEFVAELVKGQQAKGAR